MIDYLFLFDAFLLIVVTAVAVAVVEIKNLFASVMLAGLYSLLMALIWTNMHAVDVAFTEAAVGAGISSILLIGSLVICGKHEKVGPRIEVGPLLIVIITGAVLIYGTMDMPNFGEESAPIHQYRAKSLFQQNVGKVDGHPLYEGHPHDDHAVASDAHASHGDEGHGHDDHGEHASASHHIKDDFHGHVPNTVTSLLADYRGFDTMMETAVILTAGVSMVLLLRRRREDELPVDQTNKQEGDS
ncbi:MAG: DUF4040 domain-containing protein [Planctomycetes bacterium]|nr:DUF4040 domain-containing protein [Planctomycetota bacterium]